MSKTLDEYIGAEVKTEAKVETKIEAKAVYLASAEGFNNYCSGCAYLVKVEEVKTGLFSKRVFCKAEKCVK